MEKSVRRRQIDWINAILEVTSWKRQNLAAESGVSPATFSKFFNDPANAAELDARTVRKIGDVSPLPPYETELAHLPRGLADGEAQLYDDASEDDPAAVAIRAIKAGRNGVDAWLVSSRALETAGYMLGDIMVVDLNLEPNDGDVVCAQVYDRFGRAQTVFRIYDRPFLVAATYDRANFKPLYLHDDHVQVRGVVVGSFRPRQALAS